MTCHKFSKEFISKFVDNALDTESHDAFIRHKTQCPDCCAAEKRFRRTGMIFERQADAMAGQVLKNTPKIFINTGGMGYESFIDRITKRKSRKAQAILGMLSFAVAAAIISLAPWHQEQLPTRLAVPGPSAVVNSVDAYGSSVMILETAKTHHTIIWFSET